MVDFRYHLVSLVSVFLALALGIILGAGPLQNSIGDTLSGQVDTLRTSRDEARAELSQTQTVLEGSEGALAIAGEQLLPGTLTDRNIAIVVLPGASADTVSGLEKDLDLSGANVSAQITLTSAFADSAKGTYRGALASQLQEYVEGLPENPTNDQVIAGAIDVVLRNGPDDPNAKILLGSLTSEEDALFSVDREITAPADAILFIAPATLYPEDDDLASEDRAEIEAQSGIFTNAFDTSASRGPTVALGRALEDNDLLVALRDTKNGSTVDSVGTVSSQINVPLAIAAELTDSHVALGTEQRSEAALGQRIEAPRPAENPADSAPEDDAQD
ncbi:copper transporter [Actinomycetaceae bacterium L2_0104]